jgi:hypothetical protein
LIDLREGEMKRLASLVGISFIMIILIPTGVGAEISYQVSPTSDNDCSNGQCRLQPALNVAAMDGDDSEIRLAQSNYNGNFEYLPAIGGDGYLKIQGGWNSTFTVRTTNPASTVLDGNNNGIVLKLNDVEVNGGVAIKGGGSLEVDGITLRNGNASTYGGGLVAVTAPPASIKLKRNIFENNTAAALGGGCIVLSADALPGSQGGNVTLDSNIIRNNSATDYMGDGEAEKGEGGGCMVFSSTTTIITNNLIYGNSAGIANSFNGTGGGLYIDSLNGSIYIVNNTIADNQVNSIDARPSGNGGGINVATNDDSGWSGTTVSMYNNIVYGNVVKENNTALPGAAWDISNSVAGSGPLMGSLTIAYSDFMHLRSQNGSVAPVLTRNLNSDPKFSTGISLYQLTEGSQCIDTGSNSAPHMPIIDLAGKVRPQDGDGNGTATTNMGAYEGVISKGSLLPAVYLLLQ